MKIGIFYGSRTGSTKQVAQAIRDELGQRAVDELDDIANIELEDLLDFDLVILGVPTWDIGALQSDWNEQFGRLCDLNFTDVKVAMFGLGDQRTFQGHFVDAMGTLYDAFLRQGAQGGIGFWPTDRYEFERSKAQRGHSFCGLAIDEVNQPSLTASRIELWCAQVKRELGLVDPYRSPRLAVAAAGS
ncbi:MAG: flavodoxin [Myxococcota bacterium]|nr:flavodoxin [Myxococcota bacterium]